MFFLIWRSHHTSDNPSFPNLLFYIKVWCVFPRLQRIWINLTFLALLFLAFVLLFPRVHLVVQCEMNTNFCLSIIWTFVWSHPIGYCLDRKVKKPEGKKGRRQLYGAICLLWQQSLCHKEIGRKQKRQVGKVVMTLGSKLKVFPIKWLYMIHEAVVEQDSLIIWSRSLLKIQILV